MLSLNDHLSLINKTIEKLMKRVVIFRNKRILKHKCFIYLIVLKTSHFVLQLLWIMNTRHILQRKGKVGCWSKQTFKHNFKSKMIPFGPQIMTVLILRNEFQENYIIQIRITVYTNKLPKLKPFSICLENEVTGYNNRCCYSSWPFGYIK